MTERVPGSFRDPAGFVFKRDGVIYRQVNESHRPAFDACVESGLYAALQGQGLLIDHEVVDTPPADPSAASLVLRPVQVPFVTYPYEWSPGQLRAAAEVTLAAQRVALDLGFVLRDASAYNVQFLNGRPILIDTLSFEPLVEGEPWVAYGQFCRHFLAPLALARYCDVRLAALSRIHVDGIPLDLAASLLPRRTRFTPGLGIHIHAHASSQRRHAADHADGDKSSSRPVGRVSRQALVGLVDNLQTTTRRQVWEPPRSTWRDYYQARESYSADGLVAKRALVADLLGSTSPRSVWDIGANTGVFSRLAAEVTGAEVVAIEQDVAAVELGWRELQEDTVARVVPCLMDLTNPSPAQGWAHTERDSLQGRGPTDVMLALAVIHHLAIGNNVPLDAVMAWFAKLCRTLIIEWVPKSDPMVRRLLASREDVFEHYSTKNFEAAARAHFRVREQRDVADSERTIYLLDAL